MSVIKDMVTNPHWVHSRYAAYWDFLLQSYEGGVDYSNSFIANSNKQESNNIFGTMYRVFVNGVQQNNQDYHGNLFVHPKEKKEDYNRRVQMSYYYNFCAPIVDIYTDHLFKQAVIVDYSNIKDDVEQIKENVDRQGSSIDEFRRNVAAMAQKYGHCFVVVDSPDTSGTDVLTRADQIENSAFPYFTLYEPQSIINWSLDEFGEPYWVLLREVYNANKDPMAFDKKKIHECYYRLWTRAGWILYNSDYEKIKEGTHALGCVPIVCYFDKKSQKTRNFLGVSSLADIAFIARDIYNSSSELRQILRDQTFAFLAVQGDPTEYSALDLGTGKGLLYPEGRNVPQYVSPPGDNARIYFDHIDRQIGKIFQIAKLDSGISARVASPDAMVDNQSGASKAWDFNQTNSALSSKSSNLEDGETRMWGLFAKWLGKEFEGSVQYPNEFSVSSLDQDLRQAETEARLALGKTFKSESLKAIVRKKYPRKKEEDLKIMDKEIEDLAAKAETGSALSQKLGDYLKQRTATGG